MPVVRKAILLKRLYVQASGSRREREMRTAKGMSIQSHTVFFIYTGFHSSCASIFFSPRVSRNPFSLVFLSLSLYLPIIFACNKCSTKCINAKYDHLSFSISVFCVWVSLMVYCILRLNICVSLFLLSLFLSSSYTFLPDPLQLSFRPVFCCRRGKWICIDCYYTTVSPFYKWMYSQLYQAERMSERKERAIKRNEYRGSDVLITLAITRGSERCEISVTSICHRHMWIYIVLIVITSLQAFTYTRRDDKLFTNDNEYEAICLTGDWAYHLSWIDGLRVKRLQCG